MALKSVLIKFTLFFSLFLFKTFSIYPFVQYQISGVVAYNGIGIKDIVINCSGKDSELDIDSKTDESGGFFFYIPNGVYQMTISDGKGYVDKDVLPKIITIKDKNIQNVVFLLEKECKISGHIMFVDNSPIKNASVFIRNERCVLIGNTNESGFFIVNNIKASEKNEIRVMIFGSETLYKENIVLKEGDVLTDVNFLVEKKISISGRVIDKSTKNPIDCVALNLTDEKQINIPNDTDKNGEFTFYNLHEGKYTLLFFNPIYKPYTITFTFNGTEEKKLSIELEKSN